MDSPALHIPRHRSRINPSGTLRAVPNGLGATAAGNYEKKNILDYLGGLRVSQGRRTGQRLTVLDWQAQFVREAFADGVLSAALSVGRANGKTALLAGIAAATLDGPLHVPRGETVIVASSFDQARIAFEHVRAFMGGKLGDRKRWKVWDTGQRARIENRITGARVYCVGSDPRRAHGLAPVLVLADEGSQWPDSTGERMVAALRTAAGKQPHSRFVALGTRPAAPQHWFAKMLAGGADYAQTHAALPDDPLFQRRTWVKANPSMGLLPDLEAAIAREAEQAKDDPGLLASFKALRLNMGTHDTDNRDLLVTPELWAELLDLPEAPAEGRKTWGIDLGGAAAMSAVACVWETGRLQCLGMFGQDPRLEDRALRDGAGSLYATAHEVGELLISGRRIPDIAELFDTAAERFGGRPDKIVCDRWRVEELRDALDNDRSWQTIPLVTRGQGYKDGSEDVRAWRSAAVERWIKPVKPCALLTGALAEAVTLSDPAGNEKLARDAEGGRRKRARDDVAAAAILAVAHAPKGQAMPTGSVTYGGLV